MPRETIYRYECSLCRNHIYAKSLPLQWVEAYIDGDEVSVSPREENVLFCPEHAKIMTGEMPIRVLHPNIKFLKGLCQPLNLMAGAERFPQRLDRT